MKNNIFTNEYPLTASYLANSYICVLSYLHRVLNTQDVTVYLKNRLQFDAFIVGTNKWLDFLKNQFEDNTKFAVCLKEMTEIVASDSFFQAFTNINKEPIIFGEDYSKAHFLGTSGEFGKGSFTDYTIKAQQFENFLAYGELPKATELPAGYYYAFEKHLEGHDPLYDYDHFSDDPDNVNSNNYLELNYLFPTMVDCLHFGTFTVRLQAHNFDKNKNKATFLGALNDEVISNLDTLDPRDFNVLDVFYKVCPEGCRLSSFYLFAEMVKAIIVEFSKGNYHSDLPGGPLSLHYNYYIAVLQELSDFCHQFESKHHQDNDGNSDFSALLELLDSELNYYKEAKKADNDFYEEREKKAEELVKKAKEAREEDPAYQKEKENFPTTTFKAGDKFLLFKRDPHQEARDKALKTIIYRKVDQDYVKKNKKDS